MQKAREIAVTDPIAPSTLESLHSPVKVGRRAAYVVPLNFKVIKAIDRARGGGRWRTRSE
jgi:hypothetical protein